MHWCNREEIKLQCDWEYHFSDSEPPHHTQLDKLTANELTGLPTSNLDAECNFSKLSWLSEVARFCNNKFSAEGIWNDMTLFKSKKELQNMIRKSFKHKRKTVEWETKWIACNPYQRKNAERCETERICQKAPWNLKKLGRTVCDIWWANSCNYC